MIISRSFSSEGLAVLRRVFKESERDQRRPCSFDYHKASFVSRLWTNLPQGRRRGASGFKFCGSTFPSEYRSYL